MAYWNRPLVRNGRPRRTFKSWQIPKQIREQYEINDGDQVKGVVSFGRSSRRKSFHVTSGGELYLGSDIADEVGNYARKNPKGSVSFTILRAFRNVDARNVNAFDDIRKAKPELRDLPETTRRAIIAARIGQGEFRARLMRKHGKMCAVTGVAIPELLRASHIKPWRESNNEERLSADNGLLLIANLDAAFDAKLISFTDKGEVLFSQRLGPNPHLVLGIGKASRLKYLPSKRQQQYLAHHRKTAEQLL